MTWDARGGDIRAVAFDVCLVALARGELIRDGRRWRFGRRCFSNATVRRLIDEGAAVRSGDVVRAAIGPATCEHRIMAATFQIAGGLHVRLVPEAREEGSGRAN